MSGALRTRAERHEAGRDLRRFIPRSAHAAWSPPPHRPDPLDWLAASAEGRIAELLPVRAARMQPSAFAFLRGTAGVMAADLATQPSTGLVVQAGGDAHIGNFGSFLSPENTPVFDVNDFDETAPAPFEWDVKRLGASLVLAGEAQGLGRQACRALARRAAHAYRTHMAWLAELQPFTAWRTQIDLRAALAGISGKQLRARVERRLERAWTALTSDFNLVDRATAVPRLRDKDPKVFHIPEQRALAEAAFAAYGATLQEDRRALLDRYRMVDLAFKVAGVGSVGTFCAIGLFADADGASLLLQIKQAQASVLEAVTRPSPFRNHGQRVVTGQRIIQANADIFLGWTQDPASGRDFYVRRLKDSKLADVGAAIEAEMLPFTAALCGRTLARAHARSGDPAAIAGYLGDGPAFDNAIGDFSTAYAAQATTDYHHFLAAIESGRIEAHEA